MEFEENNNDEHTNNEEENSIYTLKRKERIISFSRINKYYFFPFLYAISLSINYQYLGIKIGDRPFIKRTIECLNFIITGIICFIPSKCEKTNIKRPIKLGNRGHSIKLLFNENNSIPDKAIANSNYIYFLILLIPLLLSIGTILPGYFYNQHEDHHILSSAIFFFLFGSIFSKIILKENIFYHQKLSIGLSFLGFIFIDIFKIIKLDKSDIRNNIINIIYALTYSLAWILMKDLTENYYMFPFSCLFYVGIIKLILIIIFNIIYSFYKSKDLSIVTDDFKSLEIMLCSYLLLKLIFGIIYAISMILTIYYLSPMMLIVADIINIIISSIYETIINKGEKDKLIIYYIGCFILLIGSLIYNEIIILNFCGLNKNTTKYINKRQKKEILLLLKKDNDSNSEIEEEEIID